MDNQKHSRDKPIEDYGTSLEQMGDLLLRCGDPISKLSRLRKKRLRRRLERYMVSTKASLPIRLNLGTCILIIKGPDEAGNLYYYIN